MSFIYPKRTTPTLDSGHDVLLILRHLQEGHQTGESRNVEKDLRYLSSLLESLQTHHTHRHIDESLAVQTHIHMRNLAHQSFKNSLRDPLEKISFDNKKFILIPF